MVQEPAVVVGKLDVDAISDWTVVACIRLR